MNEEQFAVNSPRSDFLFAQPSFWSGLARCLNLSGKFDFYNVSPSEDIADARALYSDWRAVGQLIFQACQTFGKEIAARQQTLPFPKGQWQSRDEHARRRTDKARITGQLSR